MTRKFTRARDLAAHIIRRHERARRSVFAAAREEAEEMLRDAVRFSSGPFHTAKGLAQAGHPYARRRPTAPALPLGIMSGRLARSWRIIPQTGSGSVSYRLQNVSPEGRYVLQPGGTVKMIARPVLPTVRARARVRGYRRLLAAKRRAERG